MPPSREKAHSQEWLCYQKRKEWRAKQIPRFARNDNFIFVVHFAIIVRLQLYTVRGAMKEDFEGTLAKVAQTGYREVELAGYFDKAPKDIRGILDRLGLSAPSEHVPYGTVDKKWPET